MRHITIPPFFANKLADTDELLLVQQYLSTFDDWYQLNDNVFFRDYTDHGPKHIEEVWSTAEQLLTTESKQNFSAADCALLICSTLLHDFAMHLQEDSFVVLVTKECSAVGESDFGDSSWVSLWKEYISEIHRLPESSRINLFGTSIPIEPPNLKDTDSWSVIQHRYIGEFVRRHHPRIAYEITLSGIPGTKGTLPIDRIEEDDSMYPLSMLSGIVARSHGMSLRDTFDIIDRDYHLIIFQESHPIYVMILLRIADYVQLQSSRAPKSLLKIKRLKSPLSQSEWGLHESIQGVSFDTEPDPEVLHVRVLPKKSSIESYLKTQRLLTSIQKELDNSWAVLGEIYGRFEKENWGITIRRIRSNIEDKDNFGRAAGFIPEEVKFTSANTELTKLLIKPLYGDYPEIAVRELVQNSIDACRERAFCEGARTKDELGKYSVKVEIINNTDGTTTLRVSDSGIGMTLDVLRRYFLNAGSSFRASLAWKKQFSNDKSKSEVLRSGRFGVGALAAFLIADDPSEIHLAVHSRHLSAAPDESVSFDTTLSDAPISVNFATKGEVGTVISVTTSSPPSFMRSKESEEKEGLSWDWYCLDWPRVERSLSTGKVLPQKYKLPTENSDRKMNNIRANFVQVNGFDSVCWYYGDGHPVVCNGIRVIEKKSYQNDVPNLFEEKTVIGRLELKFPNISVMDKDGLLPLTLDRLRLDFDQLPFMRELREDVLLSFVSGLAVCAPESISEKSFELANSKLNEVIGHFNGVSISSIAWIISNNQIAPFSISILNQVKGTRIIELSSIEDLKFVRNPSEYTIIFSKKSVYGNLQKNINSGKYLHFLSDRNAHDRLERALHSIREENRFEHDKYMRDHNDWLNPEDLVEPINKDFITSLKGSNKTVSKLLRRFERNNTHKGLRGKIHREEAHYIMNHFFMDLHYEYRGHHLVREVLDFFEHKQNFMPLDGRDGRKLADTFTMIADAEPQLKENVSNDYNEGDCPVDWPEVNKSLNYNNEEWFLASWILKDEIDMDENFLGDAWHNFFGTDFIPLTTSERNTLFETMSAGPSNIYHLKRWQEELEKI